MTDAERKRREREKRRASGQIRIEAWIPAAARDAVLAAIAATVVAHQEKGE